MPLNAHDGLEQVQQGEDFQSADQHFGYPGTFEDGGETGIVGH
jgi:hypothetical protein